MSNLRKRILKNVDNDAKESPSIIKRVQFAINDVIINKSSSKNQKVEAIEKGSIFSYIVAFVIVLIGSRYLIAYIHDLTDDYTVGHQDKYTRLFFDVPCSKDYEAGGRFKKCSPKNCGRVIKDNLFTQTELNSMKSLVEKGMQYGGGSGGATILDLHSGALSYNDKFVNLYQLAPNAFTKTDFKLYSSVKNKILNTIAKEFNIQKKFIYLTKPTFFSRMNNKSAITKHDEYWHPHIDRVTYGTFYYTSLLYLSEYGVDFTGGRFIFVDQYTNKTIEPRVGRLSFFTSGSENKHFVEKVESGTRYAITVSFTCDEEHAIDDPSLS